MSKKKRSPPKTRASAPAAPQDGSNKPAGERKAADVPDKISPGKRKSEPPRGAHASSSELARLATAPEAQEGLLIVGIGASAGGLEALEAFFKAMPDDPGMAFVLVVHLDPTHVSILPELLQKHTKMAVRQVEDGQRVERNHVYVIPPNKHLTILNGALCLLDVREPRGAHLPIDGFFRSLAQDQQRRAVGIVLSGTGTDGTLGVKAIKSAAGMVMVQSEESAKFDGMPQSAMATGLADYVLPPEGMAGRLLSYAKHATITTGVETGEAVSKALQKVFVILRAQTSHDFSLYKKNTISRRIERRMAVHGIHDINQYVHYLQDNDREAELLFKQLLIGVTSFFRDAEAFEALGQKALPQLLSSKSDEYVVRVWVPGCASGEEAYSVAILLYECLDRLRRPCRAQVFATDIDEDAIGFARLGMYPEGIASDLDAERLRRFFVQVEDGRYRVKKQIREMLIFAPQNVIMDPPFTKLDLVCCRNLLIYLEADLQQTLLSILHYSLAPDGILFLGSSETIGSATDLFARVSKKWKVFRRRPAPLSASRLLDFPAVPTPPGSCDRGDLQRVRQAEELSTIQLLEAILHESEALPCAVVNDARDVVYIHGRTGSFLEPPAGRPSSNILSMARPELREPMAAALCDVSSRKKEVVRQTVNVQHRDGNLLVNLLVKPILEGSAASGLTMVVFEEASASSTRTPHLPPPKPVSRKAKTVEQLEQELQSTREHLQTMIEEFRTSNEELKSTNEELQSTNEELRSTNEELEMSKEELQSLNEESSTVNAELQGRIDDISKTNDDMKNLLDSTKIATVFLDMELRVRRFTPSVTTIVRLKAVDIGRPISDLVTELPEIELAEFGRLVLDDLVLREKEVTSKAGRHYIMRVRPYRTVANVIDGVVITFEDITRLKHAEQSGRLGVLLRDSNDAIIVQDPQGTILAWNHGAERIYGYDEDDALGMDSYQLVPDNQRQATLDAIHRALRGEDVRSVHTQRHAKDGRLLQIRWTVTMLPSEGDGSPVIISTERDVTALPENGP